MVFEELNLNFDIKKLEEHLTGVVFKYEMIKQAEAFGGWSVLSSDGTYQDGWHSGHKQFIEKKTSTDFTEGIKRSSGNYILPTEICTGYMDEVIKIIQAHNLNPRRARIIKLNAKSESVWHSDAPVDMYSVRLHVPIITNPECFFETRSERAHLKNNGSAYLLYVNREHRVINHGNEDRYHLVMDVIDNSGLSKYHQKI